MKRKYFKLNLDDVTEIVSEYAAEKAGFKTFITRSFVYDEDGWYMLIAVGDLEDTELLSIDMEELKKNVEYNGTHGDGYWQTDEDIKRAMEGYLNKYDRNSFFDRVFGKIKNIFKKS